MHSARLDYYKGNFTQFHSTKSERERNLRKEYDSQLEYRQHLQAFIDRWRYNANRGASRRYVLGARAESVGQPRRRNRRSRSSKRRVNTRPWRRRRSYTPQLPELTPPETEETETFKFPEVDKLSPPLLQLSKVTFGYSADKLILKDIDFDVGLDSRFAIVGANGAGKSTLIKVDRIYYGLRARR
jgi:ATP-binding cassette subfamily F protein 3